MVDRPILFSGPMVRALLDGRKTQTRRVLEKQPPEGCTTLIGPEFYVPGVIDEDGELQPGPDVFGVYTDEGEWGARVRFEPGDRLWVRESFSTDFANYYPFDKVWYMADNDRRYEFEALDGVRGIRSPETSNLLIPFRWRPSIHMPRWASRLTLIVEDVRVERLQAISEADAMAEGAFKGKASGRVFNNVTEMRLGALPWASARDWYADLWDAINGDGAWLANPWVVAVSFRVVRANIDAPDFAERLPLARASCTECNGTGLQSLGNGTYHGCVACYPQLLQSRFADVELDGCTTADQADAVRRHNLQRDIDARGKP
jgi:hypothetical protein